ncbi:MAG TPA: HAMP domain-containing protein, partial [Thermoleophilaceae bacterium]|nr:HAMP domain-containing protein [Thermoleophilaceae bacterium]
MSFRARLRLFFVLLVIVPMIALAVVLFTLTARSETGKADAGISAGTRTAFALYEDAARAAEPALRRVASDRGLRATLTAREGVDAQLERLVGAAAVDPAREPIAGGAGGSLERFAGRPVLIELHAPGGERIASAGDPTGVAPATAPVAAEGQTLGVLSVSITSADQLARGVQELTGLAVAVYSGDRLLAATAGGLGDRGSLGQTGEPHDVEAANGSEYRARVESIPDPPGPPVELAILQDSSGIDETISDNRLTIAGLLVAFLLLAMLAASGISRALTGQIRTFLDAARRLARGDFAHPVPVTGRDEFAELGREFNSMSSQLETKIEEIERKREELEATIRRVGDALATGLDRDGVVALAVRQAVDAC